MMATNIAWLLRLPICVLFLALWPPACRRHDNRPAPPQTAEPAPPPAAAPGEDRGQQPAGGARRCRRRRQCLQPRRQRRSGTCGQQAWTRQRRRDAAGNPAREWPMNSRVQVVTAALLDWRAASCLCEARTAPAAVRSTSITRRRRGRISPRRSGRATRPASRPCSGPESAPLLNPGDTVQGGHRTQAFLQAYDSVRVLVPEGGTPTSSRSAAVAGLCRCPS